MASQVVGHNRRDKAGDALMAMHAKLTAWRQLRSTSSLVSLLQVVQDLRAALVILAPDLGQADPPCGSVQEACAQHVFQRLHLLAYGCLGQVQPACGG